MAIWSHVQGAFADFGGTSPKVLTLGAAPGLADIVVVAIVAASGSTITSVVDSNSNAYSSIPGNPFVAITGNNIYFFVLFSAPANASATININFTTASSPQAWAEEFSLTSGLAAVDNVPSANGSGTSGTTVNQPTVTPSTQNEVLFAICLPVNCSVTAPTSGASQGGWTGSAGGIGPNGNGCEYAMNITSSQAVNFTLSSSPDVYSCFALALESTAMGSNFNIYMLAN